MFAPDVFIINQRTKCIVHVYDDRGIEIMNVDKKYNQLIKTHLATR